MYVRVCGCVRVVLCWTEGVAGGLCDHAGSSTHAERVGRALSDAAATWEQVCLERVISRKVDGHKRRQRNYSRPQTLSHHMPTH